MQVDKPNRQKFRVFQQNYDFRGQFSIQKIIREKNKPKKEAENPKTLTKNEFEKNAKLLTDLASSKRTTASKKLHSAKA